MNDRDRSFSAPLAPWYQLVGTHLAHQVILPDDRLEAWQGTEARHAHLPRRALLRNEGEALPPEAQRGILMGDGLLVSPPVKTVIERINPADCRFVRVALTHEDSGASIPGDWWLAVPQHIAREVPGYDSDAIGQQVANGRPIWIDPAALCGRDLWLFERPDPVWLARGVEPGEPEILISRRLQQAFAQADLPIATQRLGSMHDGRRHDPVLPHQPAPAVGGLNPLGPPNRGTTQLPAIGAGQALIMLPRQETAFLDAQSLMRDLTPELLKSVTEDHASHYQDHVLNVPGLYTEYDSDLSSYRERCLLQTLLKDRSTHLFDRFVITNGLRPGPIVTACLSNAWLTLLRGPILQELMAIADVACLHWQVALMDQDGTPIDEPYYAMLPTRMIGGLLAYTDRGIDIPMDTGPRADWIEGPPRHYGKDEHIRSHSLRGAHLFTLYSNPLGEDQVMMSEALFDAVFRRHTDQTVQQLTAPITVI